MSGAVSRKSMYFRESFRYYILSYLTTVISAPLSTSNPPTPNNTSTTIAITPHQQNAPSFTPLLLEGVVFITILMTSTLTTSNLTRAYFPGYPVPLIQKQQGNGRPHVARIVQAFFQRRRVSLLPWPACSPEMSPIEHVCDMVGQRFIRQGPPAPTLDALWTHIQTALRDIPQEDIQGLFDSMP